MDNLAYDESGKIILENIYNQPVPVDYFSKLSKLDYCIPQEAKPYFEQLIAARRKATGRQHVKFIDVGCSYGVNAALLKYDLTMDELVDHYSKAGRKGRDALLASDQSFYDAPADPDLEAIGVDMAANAIDYSARAGILDNGITANLEEDGLDEDDAAVVANADLVISTGCFGYISEASLERLYENSADNRPWMAHYVLRMFDFEPAAEMLAQHGYVTEKVDGFARQRRFASPEEREHVLGNLKDSGIDADGLESEGWYYAQLHVSLPKEMSRDLPVSALRGAGSQISAGA